MRLHNRLMLLATSLMLSSLWAGPAQAEWIQQYSAMGDGNDIFAISAVDDQHAVAVGVDSSTGNQSPLVLYTSNGGTQWSKGTLPGQFSFLLTLSMVDSKTVYGGGLGLYKSSNGGQSYESITASGLTAFTSVIGLDAVNASYAYGVSESTVFFTNNGMQWQKTDTGVAPEFVGVDFINSTTGWICGGLRTEITETDPYSGEEKVVGYDIQHDGTVMRTKDAGKTFEAMTIGAPCYFSAITFVDENIGIAVAQSNDKPNFFKRTTDSGKTWVDVALPAHNYGDWQYVTQVVMLDPLTGYAAGSVGQPEGGYGNKAVVISTFDGGSTWSFVQEAEQSGTYFDITFPCKHTGWVAGSWGQIWKYDDGVGCDPVNPPDPDAIGEDGVSQDVVEQDVFTWGSVLGTFGDDVLVNPGSSPLGESDSGGTGPIIGENDDNCRDVTTTTSCSTSGDANPLLVWPLMALLTVLLWLARKHRARSVVAMLAMIAMVGCGEEETQTICEESDTGIASTLPDIVSPDPDATGTPQAFSCGLPMGSARPELAPGEGRSFDTNNVIVFVKQHEGGGSDLYLTTEDGKQTVALTAFNDPSVEVQYPSWSPDRSRIAFVSNYRSDYSVRPFNVFLISVDATLCYQVTPDISLTTLAQDSDETATITGSFRFGTGAIANPVAGARVTHTRGQGSVLTGSGGEFIISVPPGTGKLVVRGQVNGITIVGSADFEVQDGENLVLETPLVGTAQPELTFGPLRWSFDGQSVYSMVDEQIRLMNAIDMNSGAMAPFLESESDSVVSFATFPRRNLIAVAYRSTPALMTLLDPEDDYDAAYEFEFPGQTEESTVSVSPLHFFASVQNDHLVLLGAEESGEIGLRTIEATGLSGLVPHQLDWNLTGDKIVVTVASGTKTNLLVVDVNSNGSRAITTDGTNSMPAWGGR